MLFPVLEFKFILELLLGLALGVLEELEGGLLDDENWAATFGSSRLPLV